MFLKEVVPGRSSKAHLPFIAREPYSHPSFLPSFLAPCSLPYTCKTWEPHIGLVKSIYSKLSKAHCTRQGQATIGLVRSFVRSAQKRKKEKSSQPNPLHNFHLFAPFFFFPSLFFTKGEFRTPFARRVQGWGLDIMGLASNSFLHQPFYLFTFFHSPPTYGSLCV